MRTLISELSLDYLIALKIPEDCMPQGGESTCERGTDPSMLLQMIYYPTNVRLFGLGNEVKFTSNKKSFFLFLFAY